MSTYDRRQTGIAVVTTTGPWFREFFGEFNTEAFADGDKLCRHCQKGKALVAECYQGLCHSCWTDLVFYCMEWARAWCDRRNLWGRDRPDTLKLALLRIRVRIEKGTFDDLLAVAIDGANPKELARKRRKREYAKRYYQEHKEEVRVKARAYAKRYYERNKKIICEKHVIYDRDHPEKRCSISRRWRQKHRDELREYKRMYYLRRKAQRLAKQQKEDTP